VINYPLTPYKGVNWNPQLLSNQKYWYDYGRVVLSGSNVTTWTQKFLSPASGVVNISFSGTLPVYNTLQQNNHPSLANALNTLGNITSPTTVQLVDAAQPFTLAYVHKGPALTLGTFYLLFSLAGTNAADSPRLFYTNLSGAPVFYLQIGNGTVTVIGTSGFTPSDTHYAILTYDGSGYASASSWSLTVNGAAQTLAATSAGGGGANINTIGDSTGGGATPPLHFWEMMLVGSNSPTNLSSLQTYLSQKYAL
jgi:hypothetical protein